MSWQQLIVMVVDMFIYKVRQSCSRYAPHMKMFGALIGYILLAAVGSACASIIISEYLI
jgi:hypothetical protein